MVRLYGFLRKLLGIVPLVVFASPLSANTQDADDLFAKAVKAFRAGDYQYARNHFVAAHDAGNNGARLYYNLGVVDYRLGYYPSSYEFFEKAALDPELAALAYYNLGLVSLKLYKNKEAIESLETARALASDAGLKQLAVAMLEKVRDWRAVNDRAGKRLLANTQKTGFNGESERRRGLRAVLKSDLGFDDNVILYRDAAVSKATDVSDQFFTLHAVVQERLSTALAVNLSVYRLDYLHKHDYDYAKLGVETRYTQAFGQWALGVGGELKRLSLGGQEYQQVAVTTVEAKRTLRPGVEWRLGYDVELMSALDDLYAHLAGRRDRLESNCRLGSRRRALTLYYRFEYNDRNDFFYDSRLYTSYSPIRHTVGASVSRMFFGKLELDGFTDFTLSDYRAPDILQNGHQVRRHDELLKAGLRLSLALGRRAKLEGNYYFADNQSILTKNWYRNNRYWLGLRWDY